MGDGGVGNDGGGDGGPPPDACIPFPTESCNEVDDDCDGLIDEGIDLQTDDGNCGVCGNECFAPNTNGNCVAGGCEYACQFGWVDDDVPANVEDGCEYFCTPSNGGVERCDFADNDCNGLVDDGLALDTDENNCGECGNRCLALNADPVCDGGECTFGQCDPQGSNNCTLLECDPGFADIEPGIAGCEYACPRFPPIVGEECNGIDDDCDGTADELPISGLGGDCTEPGFETQGDTGACTFGTLVCDHGVPTCSNYERPQQEVCNEGLVTPADEADDDCDGQIDDGFDTDTDVRNCGACGNDCTDPNDPVFVEFAIPECTGGGCEILTCLPGHVDFNDDPSDGCEYACTATGPEVCDGVDNDCDTLVDTADTDLDELAEQPADFCDPDGPCAPTRPTCIADPCSGVVSWQCDYDDNVETDSCGDIRFAEARCDNIDGNCGGGTDESFAELGDECSDGLEGICESFGQMQCDDQDPTTTECVIDDPGEPASPTELCNNEDDDCDGDTDEDAPDDMVAVTDGGTTFYIYTYEASRPDADEDSFGTADHRACSGPGRMPWRFVTQTDAALACAAAGKRLCTADEWQLACGGPVPQKYPYDPLYNPNACNGRDADSNCDVAGNQDTVAPSGTDFDCTIPEVSSCVSDFSGAIDMSGNLKEWTDTLAETPCGGVDEPDCAYRVRGGAFDNIRQGLTCDYDFLAFEPDTSFPNLGFRCCAAQDDN